MGYPARKSKTKAKTNTEHEIIHGTIQRVRFHNQANGYCVISIDTGNESTGLITAVGYMPSIREGDEFNFKGYWTNNPKYGKQFVFEEYELLLPQSRQGIIRYLSTLAYGVGKVKAAKIVDVLGEDCITKLKENPEALNSVPDITLEQAEEIITKLNENTVLAELSSMICRQGVSPGLAARIYNQYGPESIDVVKNNPYVLSDDMYRVGFITADRIAQAMGVDPDSPYRVEAALEFILKNATKEGHCYLPPQELIIAVKKVLGKGCAVGVDEIKAANRGLVRKEKTVFDTDAAGKGCIYLKSMYDTEIKLAERVRELLEQKVEVKGDIDKMVELAQKVIGMEYAPEQKEAIKTVLSNPLSIISGGPGTGKSTVTNGILINYQELYPDNYIYLAAPTGRAAKRMAEVTGQEAKTIHRLLEYHPEIGFRVNKMNPLNGPGLLIVDEFSMTDIELSANLFDGIPNNMQVVLVGDVDQLPSVGPGNVLRDLIESGVVPSVRLKYNYRQANGSKIAEYANTINMGIVPPLASNNLENNDVESIFIDDVSEVAQKVLNEVQKALDNGYGLMDFQVLTPIHRGPAGVGVLNEAIQNLINPAAPGKKEYKQFKEVFRVGDKVMVVKNDYNKGVFNGDIGIVSDIGNSRDSKDNRDSKNNDDGNDGPGVYVKFESSRPVFFPAEDTGILTLAYAGTVHKSQGNEFPLVIVVCVRSHYIMLQRNLLYTAITRAKEKLVLVCQEDVKGSAVEVAVKNDKIKERFSRLKERLCKLL
ncbi:MAG: ATP-dependent RecD-like DNA helicase [Smithella sp. PtaU1.Bin162]|nr:MAG: ATP-dependent RecD-like DNA helicase [Smithella sp. PtaU1.Bin162]